MCMCMHVWPPSYIHGLLKYMASSGPTCVVGCKEAICASEMDAGTAIHGHSLSAAVTQPYLLRGEAVRGRANFFVIHTHPEGV